MFPNCILSTVKFVRETYVGYMRYWEPPCLHLTFLRVLKRGIQYLAAPFLSDLSWQFSNSHSSSTQNSVTSSQLRAVRRRVQEGVPEGALYPMRIPVDTNSTSPAESFIFLSRLLHHSSVIVTKNGCIRVIILNLSSLWFIRIDIRDTTTFR